MNNLRRLAIGLLGGLALKVVVGKIASVGNVAYKNTKVLPRP